MFNLFNKKEKNESSVETSITIKLTESESIPYSQVQDSFFMYNGTIFYRPKGYAGKEIYSSVTFFDYMKSINPKINATETSKIKVIKLDIQK